MKFNLKKNIGPRKPRPAEKIESPKMTAEDKELLYGYEFLPKAEWSNAVIGSHIRYMRNNGEFKKGGYIDRQFRAKNGDKYFALRFTPESNTYIVRQKDIRYLWIKTSAFDKTGSLEEKILIIEKFLLLKFGSEYSDFKIHF